ncbi:hypothetical protein ACQ0QQ_00415 [Lysinibacillus sphaericus]
MRKNIMLLFTSVVVLAAAYAWNQSTKLYGNDKESIIDVIKSVEGYEDKDIQLIQINDFDDVRIAGFLANQQPSYINFVKNDKGNYEWKHIESTQDEAFAMFLPGWELEKIMFVANGENDIAKMTVDINAETLKQTFPPYEPSVTWVDLPASRDGGHEYRNYTYYDENGKMIEKYE